MNESKGAPQVVCFYVPRGLNPETERRIRTYVPWAVFEDTSDGLYAYANAIERYWTGEKDLIIIEQDMGITPGTIPSFIGCDKDWCVFTYDGAQGYAPLEYSLGCTKFSASFQVKVPFSELRKLNDEPTWYNIDGLFWYVAYKKLGLRSHVHGHIEHFHDYGPKHPFVVTPAGVIDDPVATAPDMIKEEHDGFIWLYKLNDDGSKGDLVGKMESLSEDLLNHQGRYFEPTEIGAAQPESWYKHDSRKTPDSP